MNQTNIFRKISLVVLLVFVSTVLLAAPQLKTVAEASDFKATSRYNDVIEFVKELQKHSNLIKVETLCVSAEGRAIPLLVIGNPLPSSPQALKYDNRTVIYIQANIHAGEVEGKEASLMLARHILTQENPPYLDNLVILIAPIFNADGNERINKQNRRGQVGPEKGAGVRYNGQNLDLNRDGMKQESLEVQGMVRNVLNRWDPALLVDLHTTNGSYHVEPVTWTWALNPNGDMSIVRYMREKMMPSIQTILKDKYNTLGIPYGNFMDFKDPEKGWRPAGPEPRYLTNYIGLRNRMAILNENYSHADFKTRVLGCYNFLLSILDYCSANTAAINTLIAEADRNTIQRGLNPTEKDTIAVEYDLKPLEKPIKIIGYEMKVEEREGQRRPRVTRTDVQKTYTVPYYCDYTAKNSILQPYGYLITVPDKEIVKKLLQHGIVVEKLVNPVKLEVESFSVKEIKGAARPFQGHRMNTISGEYQMETKDFPAGTIFVGTGQILGNVVSYLLEAESGDGLVAWNYFDKYLVAQWGRSLQKYPVYRMLKPTPLVKTVIR